MRLVTVDRGLGPELGAEHDGAIVLLRAARAAQLHALGVPDPGAMAARDVAGDMTALLAAGEPALAIAAEAIAHAGQLAAPARAAVVVDRDAVAFLPAVTRPPKIICAGRNYAAHAAEGSAEVAAYPDLFARFAQTLIGHGAPIVVPDVSDQVDWEAELAVVIGRPARHVTAERAHEVIAGYTIFNDVSVRDYQRRTRQWLAGKNFDSSGPLGPALVTADEVADPQALTLELRVNGEVMQSASTADMVFSVAELIADITSWITLEPGDVIVTGTPSGVGTFRDPPVYLRPGDEVVVEIETLGALRNPVVAEQRP